MEIGLYEDWMKPQIANLFSMQYGVKKEDFERLIDNFYELPFQKNKCIRIVAKEGDLVIGFQSFFYWPYNFNGKTFNSYQSGNSLVHPDYRGKGIFQSLLNYVDNHKEELKIDFLIGFPIDVSIGSLLRNKWKNIFNLQWYIKTINPFSLLLPLNIAKLQEHFPNRNLFINKADKGFIRVENSPEFIDWRKTHYDKEKYFSFHFAKDKEEVLFKLKINIRKKVIKELIIGDIITTTHEPEFILKAISELVKEVKKIKSLTILSIALNENCAYNFAFLFSKQGFKRIEKQIYFCVKPFVNDNIIITPDKWIVYRGDIDTW